MTGPKERKERSLGERLQLKAHRTQGPKAALTRKPYRPGQHGQKRQRALSDFGKQIKEKQKFKLSYGIDETNLRELFIRAQKEKGSVAVQLMGLMERRLDNVIFRLGFAPARSVSRQLVVHGHIMVNKKRVRSPGYQVKPNDLITIRSESVSKTAFKDLKESLKKYEAPSWLHVDPEKIEGRVLSLPTDVSSPFEINLLVESFSK